MDKLALAARNEAVEKLATTDFDLLVIGGGITGVGSAQDAAARGLKVALVERGDYAIGTSSRSSKLIHGGLRYLAQGDFRVTYESCAERALLQELAPHLVKSISFLIPVYRWGHGLQLSIGLWLYDFISQLKQSRFHQRVGIPRAKKFAEQLDTTGMQFAFIYYDCKTNDSRLVMEVAKSAASYGAVMCNHTEVVGLIKDGKTIVGARAKDLISGREIEIRAKVVLNATGVWLDGLRRIDEASATQKVRPAKGVHILIPRSRIATESALLFESGANDGRSIFFIPWYEGIIIGTTDTDYKGDINFPHATKEDIKYILSAVQKVFPTAKLTEDDILSSYAGLRPLIDEGGKSTKDISRDHKIFDSASGLISIAGGKLTTYRRMAIHVVDQILIRLKSLGLYKPLTSPSTDHIYLSGFHKHITLEEATAHTLAQAKRIGLDTEIAQHFVDDYGANSEEIFAILAEQPSLSARLVPTLPFIQAEVIHAVRFEQAADLDDFLVRRTRIAYLTKDQGAGCASKVAHLMGAELGWSEKEIDAVIKKYQATTSAQYHAAQK